MKKILLFFFVLTISFVFAEASFAALTLFETDRFGYEGTITRYDTEFDARNATNPIETINIQDRDAGIYINNGINGENYNIIMGSWWYSTDSSGSAGWGNTTGNTGIGFMQLYDEDGSTDTALTMGFDNYDGTHWTEYSVSLFGQNATAIDDYARFSAFDNVHDAGTYIDYELSITATGLEGNESGGVITANNHPTGVNGSFYGLFTFGGDGDGYDIDGDGTDDDFAYDYYVVDLDFKTNNWAFDNQDHLTYPTEGFYDSTFVQTPIPGAVWMLGSCILGIAGLRRFKR